MPATCTVAPGAIIGRMSTRRPTPAALRRPRPPRSSSRRSRPAAAGCSSGSALPFASTAVDTPEELDSPLAGDPPPSPLHSPPRRPLPPRRRGIARAGLVLCFDTIVVLDGAVLGKPRDVPDAWRMLRALSGRTHQVVTGVAALHARERRRAAHVRGHHRCRA